MAASTTLEPRVATLEDAMRELAFQSARTQEELARLSREMRDFKQEMSDFKQEMSEFKDEMKDFKDEMSEFKDEMKDFKDEMKDFKDEMSDFKDEMSAFKDETRREHRELNKKWGDMANRLGTIVEDLVVPSLPQIIEETLMERIDDLSVRRKRRLPNGRSKEFDAIAVTPSLVCLNSTKATLRSADVDQMITDIEELREFFPDYREVPVVGILATLAAEQSVVRYATKLGFLVLAVGDELMVIQNPAGFVPRRW
jgi:chromosome segregation ATPase